MADKKNKYSDNVPGPYYVDTECINCDACLLVAENHFKINEEEGYAYVYKQPQEEEEKSACQEALEACPVEAIGNDGEEEGGDTYVYKQPQEEEEKSACQEALKVVGSDGSE